MYTIAFANPKGGSGKTTSALLLAEQILHAGASVTILDCDPNQNIIQWGKTRAEQGRAVPFSIIPVPDEEKIFSVIENVDADYLIIDLEGTASQIVTFAMSEADLVLIPFEPTPMETRQAARAVSLVENISKMAKRPIAHALLFNRMNAAIRTNDEKDVRRVTESNSVTALNVSIIKRAAYTRIFRESKLLSELRTDVEADVADAVQSKKERLLKPLDSAIGNAKDYAQAVMNMLPAEEVAA